MKKKLLFARRNCGAIEPLLWDYHRQRLSDAEEERVAAHLQTCASCRVQDQTYCSTVLAMADARAARIPESQTAWPELRARLEAEQIRTRTPARRPALAWASTAFAGLLALALFRPAVRPSMQPGILFNRQTGSRFAASGGGGSEMAPSFPAETGWTLLNATGSMERVGDPVITERAAPLLSPGRERFENGVATAVRRSDAVSEPERVESDMREFAREQKRRRAVRWARTAPRFRHGTRPLRLVRGSATGVPQVPHSVESRDMVRHSVVDAGRGPESLPTRNYVMTPVSAPDADGPPRRYVMGTVDLSSQSGKAGASGEGQEKPIW